MNGEGKCALIDPPIDSRIVVAQVGGIEAAALEGAQGKSLAMG